MSAFTQVEGLALNLLVLSGYFFGNNVLQILEFFS